MKTTFTVQSFFAAVICTAAITYLAATYFPPSTLEPPLATEEVFIGTPYYVNEDGMLAKEDGYITIEDRQAAWEASDKTDTDLMICWGDSAIGIRN